MLPLPTQFSAGKSPYQQQQSISQTWEGSIRYKVGLISIYLYDKLKIINFIRIYTTISTMTGNNLFSDSPKWLNIVIFFLMAIHSMKPSPFPHTHEIIFPTRIDFKGDIMS